MRNNLLAYVDVQVFLNYPFDNEFEPLANAMHFAVVAAGFIPVCAKDLSSPDRSRLEMLVDAIIHCRYSLHDFSRLTGEGNNNFGRFNMPIEMGMALFHALQTQRAGHRCAFFVASPHDYQIAASDLAGLDPKTYSDDELLLVGVYEWLRDWGKPLVNVLPTADVKEKYLSFKKELAKVKGSGKGNRPSHDEAQELMFAMSSDCKWWVWRENPLGKLEFPSLPLSWEA